MYLRSEPRTLTAYIATIVLVSDVDRLLRRGKYLCNIRWRAWCAQHGEKRKASPGYPCSLLLGKGSTFCRACTCGDNDRAGDIVRTCRDYVIGRSENVVAMVIPHQTSRGSASRHLHERYRLSLPFSRLFPPSVHKPLSAMFILTASFIAMHLRRLRIISPRGITTFSSFSYVILLGKPSANTYIIDYHY